MNVEKIEELKRAVNEALDLLFDRQEEEVGQSREFEESLKKWADYCKNQRNNNPCPCEDGIDSKACVGCEQDEARIVNEAWNNAIGEEKETFSPSLIERVKKLKKQQKTLQKKQRPFKDCDELIEFWSQHYQTGI